MANRRSIMAPLVVAILSLLRLAVGLQVSPNSPCSSFCIDAPDLDESDPASSNTEGDDLVCSDDDFTSKPAGQKFQRCLACLQDSAYSHGHESDQQWFFYNLRYSISYCVLGYHHATGFNSGPCALEESCGALEDALADGLLDPAYVEPYDFCDKDGGKILSDKMDSCRKCVAGTGDRHYLSNFLTAIEAGCEQQPAGPIVVGLDDTVFTTKTISIIDPTSESELDSGDSQGLHLSPAIIAGIAIGGVVLLLFIVGCTYMQIRKRRNRRARSRRTSPLDFRCQTHLTPRTPNFPSTAAESEKKNRPYVDPAAALGSNPVTMVNRQNPAGKQQMSTVGISIPTPPPMHSPSPSFVSPTDHFRTPTSTTSVRSNMPLLLASSSSAVAAAAAPPYKPYVPSDYGAQHHNNNFNNSTRGLAISTSEVAVSPYAGQQPGPPVSHDDAYDDTQSMSAARRGVLRVSTKWDASSSAARSAMGSPRGQTRKSNSPCSPVSFTNIQTSFPPPPSQKKR